MANRYCIHCGARLEEGARFCTSCGKAVEEVPSAPAASEPTSQTPAATPSAAAQPASAMAAPGTTAVMNPVQSAAPSATFAAPAPGAPASKAASGGSGSLSPTAKGVIIGVAVGVAIIALLAVMFTLHPWSSSPTSASSTSTTAQKSANDTSASSVGTSSSTSSSASTAVNDDSIFASLTNAYNKLSGFDERIRSCAADYNGTYTSTDMTVRTQNANTCKTLRSEIQQEMTALNNLNVPTSSKYYQDYKNISNLQNDLFKRIDVLSQSWAIDLTYSNPADHTAEINVPISADNDSSGINVYKTDFVNKYESSKPVKK